MRAHRTVMRCCLLGSALFALLSCEPRSTAVLVRVTGDEGIRTELAALSITVYARTGQTWTERFSAAAVAAERLLWPVEVALVPQQEEDAEFEVIVIAWDAAGRSLVVKRAVSRFVSGKTRLLPLELRDACVELKTCVEAEDCHGSRCRACQATDGAATCAAVGETATSAFSPWTPQAAVVRPREYNVAYAGDSCSEMGLRACTGHGVQSAVRCNGEVFEYAERCDAQSVCDSRIGPTLGTCRLACSEGRRGESSCEADVLVDCSVDGVEERSTCQTGYRCATFQGSARCEDVDECASQIHPCTPGACANTAGAYICTCPEGYEETGVPSCKPKADCRTGGADEQPSCWPGQCVEQIPGYTCHCPLGFEGQGTTDCRQVDECSAPDICGSGTCDDTAGSFACACEDGSTCVGGLSCGRYADGAGNHCQGRFTDYPMPNDRPELPNYYRGRDEPLSGLRWMGLLPGDFDAFERDCARAVNDDGLAWRTPTLVDAITRLHFDPFSGDTCSPIFTTTRVPDSELVFVVENREGTVTHRDPRSDFYYGCCVTSERTIARPAERVRQTEHTALYAQTGLRWARALAPDARFEDAVGYCEELSLDGFSDYRLPSARELISLVDAGAQGGRWFDTSTFPELTSKTMLWSQTPESMGRRFALDSASLEVLPYAPTDVFRALCVRFGELSSP